MFQETSPETSILKMVCGLLDRERAGRILSTQPRKASEIRADKLAVRSMVARLGMKPTDMVTVDREAVAVGLILAASMVVTGEATPHGALASVFDEGDLFNRPPSTFKGLWDDIRFFVETEVLESGS